MNSKTTTQFLKMTSILLLGLVVGLTSISCSSADNEDEIDPSVEIIVSGSQVELERSTTLNISLTGLINPQATWTITSGAGSLSASNGLTTVFTAHRATLGQTTVKLTVVSQGVILEDTITLTTVAPDDIPPAAPTNLQGSSGDNAVTLTWTPNSEADLGGYKVYLSTTSGSGFTTSFDVGNTTTHTVTRHNSAALVNGQSYFFYITAYDNSRNKNESINSSEINVIPGDTVRPNQPLNVQVNPSGNTQVRVSWVNPSDSDFEKVIILRTIGSALPTSPFQTNASITKVFEGSQETFTDTSVNQGVRYHYTIFAIDDDGHFSTPKTQSITLTN